MNKLDETNELFENIIETAQNETLGLAFHHKQVKEALLMDIAKSLAIIADKMNKEE